MSHKRTTKNTRSARSRADDKAKPAPERASTPMDRLKAIVIETRQDSQAPRNRLVQGHPGETLIACRQVVEWLGHAELPGTSSDTAMAQLHILQTITDALDHVERQTSELWHSAIAVADEVQP